MTLGRSRLERRVSGEVSVLACTIPLAGADVDAGSSEAPGITGLGGADDGMGDSFRMERAGPDNWRWRAICFRDFTGVGDAGVGIWEEPVGGGALEIEDPGSGGGSGGGDSSGWESEAVTVS